MTAAEINPLVLQLVPWALGLISSGVIAIAGLLFRLNVQGATLNATLLSLTKQFELHIQQDREDFARVVDKIGTIRSEQAVVAAGRDRTAELVVKVAEGLEVEKVHDAKIVRDEKIADAKKVKEEKDE